MASAPAKPAVERLSDCGQGNTEVFAQEMFPNPTTERSSDLQSWFRKILAARWHEIIPAWTLLAQHFVQHLQGQPSGRTSIVLTRLKIECHPLHERRQVVITLGREQDQGRATARRHVLASSINVERTALFHTAKVRIMERRPVNDGRAFRLRSVNRPAVEGYTADK